MTNDSRNRRPIELLAGARWRKSSHSGYQGNCVEIADLARHGIAVRNSRDPGGPALIFTRSEFVAFVRGVKAGAFDERDR